MKALTKAQMEAVIEEMGDKYEEYASKEHAKILDKWYKTPEYKAFKKAHERYIKCIADTKEASNSLKKIIENMPQAKGSKKGLTCNSYSFGYENFLKECDENYLDTSSVPRLDKDLVRRKLTLASISPDFDVQAVIKDFLKYCK